MPGAVVRVRQGQDTERAGYGCSVSTWSSEVVGWTGLTMWSHQCGEGANSPREERE